MGHQMPKNKFHKIVNRLIILICLVFITYQILSIIFSISPSDLQHRMVHLGFALCIIFLRTTPIGKILRVSNFISILLSILSLITSAYFFINYERLIFSAGLIDPIDMFFTITIMILVTEGARRAFGWPLSALWVIILIYSYFGSYFPGVLKHSGVSITRILSSAVICNGLYGFILGVSADIIFIFLIFGAFLSCLGGTEFFTKLALKVGGKFRSGPAMVAIISSGFMAMLSGSAAANVATTGSISIPLMVKRGYSKEIAGGVEAAASAGGQIMPPIMGTGAFVMAELLNIPYTEILLAAIIPALLYFYSCSITVTLFSIKMNLPKHTEKVAFIELIKESYFFVPIILLIFVIFSQQGGRVEVAGLYGFFSLIFLFALKIFLKYIRLIFFAPSEIMKETSPDEKIESKEKHEKRIFKAIYLGANNGANIAVATGIIGLFFHVLGFAPLTQILADNIVAFSGGNFLLVLIMTALFGIFLGFGLPTVACYIAISSLLAVVISSSGVDQLSIHLFIFYFSILSAITFPDALAVLTAVGLSGGNFFKSTLYAMEIGFAGIIVPFAFVYDNSLLLKGTPIEISFAIFSMLIGITSFAAFFEGFLVRYINWFFRISLLLAGILSIFPQTSLRLMAFIIFLSIFIINFLKKKRLHKSNSTLEDSVTVLS